MDSTVFNVGAKGKQDRIIFNDGLLRNTNNFQRISNVKPNRTKSNYNWSNIINYIVSLHRHGLADTKKMMAEIKVIGILLYTIGVPLYLTVWWENFDNWKGNVMSAIAVSSAFSYFIYRIIKQYYLVQEMKRKDRREELELRLKEIELNEQINEHKENEDDN